MKTLLVSLDSKFIHSNLAIRYLKSYCADCFDMDTKEFTINQKIELITDQIFSTKAELICFSCYIWNIEFINDIIYILKTANPKLKILLGGPEVSYDIKAFMRNNPLIDFIIYGEGEISLREFLIAIRDNKDLSTVNGLAYRIPKQDNAELNDLQASIEDDLIIINKARDINYDLDVLAFPYDYEEKDLMQVNDANRIIYYESSRGCPFRCAFCMSSIDKSVRTFSLERVKRDLLILLKTKARQIKFVDRTFNADYKRAMQIMQFIVENNSQYMSIHFEITADIINDEFLEFLKLMPVNMFQFEIGVQSTNEQTLCEINRKTNFERLIYVVNRIKEYKNIHMHLDLIAGLPYEDYESFKLSFNKIHNLYADKLQLGFLKVLKGTKIYENTDVHDIKYSKKAPYEIIRNKYISYEEILKLKNIEELVDRYYNEKYFYNTIMFIMKSFYNDNAFEFYEEFSHYWKRNNLYLAMHNRKKLYEIIYDFAKNKGILTSEFVDNLLYDFVSSNEKEELLSIFDKTNEESLREIKKVIAKNEEFRFKYFGIQDMNYRIINDFRLVKITDDIILFVYKDKENIFERCKSYRINEFLESIEYKEEY